MVVVIRLEMIHIHHDDDHFSAAMFGALPQVLQVFLKMPAVEQRGQHIHSGQLLQLQVHLAQVLDQ